MTTTKWALDPSHSEVQFKVKHLMITTVTGSFKDFSAELVTEGNDFLTAKLSFDAKTGSVDTGSAQRDGHIRSGDFFDVENFPSMTFISTKIEKLNNEGNFLLTGDLTIKDITKSVTMNVDFVGIQKDPYGVDKAGFVLDGKINRKDWNLNWNVGLESGGLLVSEEVKLVADVQMSKQVATASE